MALKTLEDALVEELEDLLNAETQITKALPKMAQKASSAELQTAFEEHLAQTREHVSRIEQAFQMLGRSAESKTCEAMKGLIKEGESLMSEEADPNVMDALLIAAAQKVEHYEIASYGTVCTWAETLELSDVHDLLGQTLGEEEEADERLTALAESFINEEAVEEG